MKATRWSRSLGPAIAWCAVLALPFVTFREVTSRLMTVWLEVGAHSHGPLMAGMAALLILQSLAGGSSDRDRPSVAGFGALVGGGITLVTSHRLQFETGAYASLPLLVFALIWALGGWPRAKASLIGVTLLLLAMPVWDPLAMLMQHLAVFGVSTIMATTSTPIFVEGVLIHIPEGSFAVEMGCSGIAYFIVAVGLALFITGRDGRSPWDAAKLGAQFALLAIVTNWIRICVLVALGRMTDMQSPLIYDHYMFGWLLFAAMIVPAVWMCPRQLHELPGILNSLPKDPPRVPSIAFACGVLALIAVIA